MLQVYYRMINFKSLKHFTPDICAIGTHVLEGDGLLSACILILLTETNENHLLALPDNLQETWEEKRKQAFLWAALLPNHKAQIFKLT